ncbi:hypothetical protein HBN50_15810 [Halobacteriovorax sp. GB3]|uniref:hypothetical protein n=1 Tax=Halobacteriovorax sp. GB3 TaxID=2719615 RepID=UPI0023605637|nr:hypothetical protein [Halobacteriovorax sp. GB3]MDD0854578.1 hypothetical protein [Halobacteriovorax sp. GB3]
MLRKISLHALIIPVFLFTATMGFARDYIIYNISQEVPMSKTHVPKKNFYVNVGTEQGLQKGNMLEVYRTVSRLDPYETKKRYTYRVKLGELKVIHSEDNAAIGVLSNLDVGEETPMTEISKFMIGDHVDLKVK